MSAETTFESDIADERSLSRRLWPISEKVAKRLKNNGISASGVTLKLKTADFRLLTRSRRISPPTRLAGTLFAAGRELLAPLADGRRYRLIGIGATHLTDSGQADTPDLLDANAGHAARLEDAMDAVRAKFGDPAIQKGRALLD
jgi:DNA polymerase-4